MIWPIDPIVLKSKAWLTHLCLTMFLCSFCADNYFFDCKLYQETGGHMLTPKSGSKATSQTGPPQRSDRSQPCSRPPVWLVGPTGQTDQTNVLQIWIGLHHWIVLVEMIEMHMCNIQFGVRMRDLWLRQYSACAGGNRSDRSPLTGQTSGAKVLKRQNRLHHWIGLVE